MQKKAAVLLVTLACLGAAAAVAFSGRDNEADNPVRYADKSAASQGLLETGEDKRKYVGLAAVKRSMPDKIGNSSLFQSKSWVQKYSPPSVPVVNSPHPTTAEPSAPQLPFIFIGRMIDGDAVVLFLTNKDQQYSAKQNDVLEGKYRLDKITEKSAMFTYLPMNLEQELKFNSSAVGISVSAVAESAVATQ